MWGALIGAGLSLASSIAGFQFHKGTIRTNYCIINTHNIAISPPKTEKCYDL